MSASFRRWLSILALTITLSALAVAQDPKVRTSVSSQGDVWVGQRLILVVELLAPGFFASAAAFDLPDPPGLIIVPPRGSPVVSSESVDGVAYTVQRHELSVIASHAGQQTVPSFTVRFQFKHQPLDKNAIAAAVKTTAITFPAKSPPGAEKLGSVISARNLMAVEAWKPEPGAVKVGDAFTRTITYSAPDVSAMAYPPFPAEKVEGLGVYPKPPEVLDREERGELQGERRDTISYVCERQGTFVIPAVRLTWWDLDTKALKAIDFPAKSLRVAGNPSLAGASATKGEKSKAPATLQTVAILLTALAVLFALIRLIRRYGPIWIQPFRPVHLAPLNPPPVERQSTRRGRVFIGKDLARRLCDKRTFGES